MSGRVQYGTATSKRLSGWMDLVRITYGRATTTHGHSDRTAARQFRRRKNTSTSPAITGTTVPNGLERTEQTNSALANAYRSHGRSPGSGAAKWVYGSTADRPNIPQSKPWRPETCATDSTCTG